MKKRVRTPAPPRAAAMETLVGRQTEILGDLRFCGGLHLDGKVKGNVTAVGGAASSLSVSESGVVEGDVEVASIVLKGTITGDVRGCAHLVMSAKARVAGDVHYRVLQMEAGAMVHGRLVHESQDAGVMGAGPPVEPSVSSTLEKRRLKPI